ncbi:MAG: polyphosphate kinase 1 [Thiobacillus sp.]|nr:polyphosphate kinase 1 [Thiobacillus sp.]
MSLPNPDTLINRELGILAFQKRVLAQAEDTEMPLLERLKFLCIVSSNMDEFFEVRVAGLLEQIRAQATQRSADGLTPRQQYRAVSDAAHALVARQYEVLNDEVIPALAERGIHFLRRTHWNETQAAWIRDYFHRELMPVLTPVGLDPSHPFPRVLNKSLNFAVELSGRDAFGRSSGAAVVQAPRALPRVIRMPEEFAGVEYGFVFLSSILHAHVGELFAGMTVEGCYQFRVTRNSDLFVDEEENKNLRETLAGELPQRHFGAAVRLEVADNCSESMANFLLEQFELDRDALYQVHGPVNLVRLMQVPDWVDRPELKFTPFIPALPGRLAKKENIFEQIGKGDILLHHPFESFQPVIDFIEEAAADPNVVAIRQTVYRTGTDSKLMQALIRAAQSGKEVTVVVELLARFDEDTNINWAQRLEQVGAHVVYGVVGHKTHAKLALVIRREDGVLKRYAHLGTGNYHARTARLYTDFGLLTSHEELTQDVNQLFTQITGLGKAGKMRRLWQSPFTLHGEIIAAIEHEADNARAGKPAAIVAKMNALLEPHVIAALYAASQAGVKIDLIVRGVCALKPGIAGLSDNIRVRSVVGRFLEHSRIFYFKNVDNEELVYLSSADWMDRNFFRRIETCFPILNPKLKKRVIAEGLKPYLRDNVQAWEMQSDGSFRRKAGRRAQPYCAQSELLALYNRQK